MFLSDRFFSFHFLSNYLFSLNYLNCTSVPNRSLLINWTTSREIGIHGYIHKTVRDYITSYQYPAWLILYILTTWLRCTISWSTCTVSTKLNASWCCCIHVEVEVSVPYVSYPDYRIRSSCLLINRLSFSHRLNPEIIYTIGCVERNPSC